MSKLLTSRKAHFNYEFLDTYEGGIQLLGYEVKALRLGRGSLEGAHAIIRAGEAYVVGMKIDQYQAGNTSPAYDPLRTRKLLFSKKEINELSKRLEVKGLTLIPVSIYTKGPKIKVEVALARGKKLFDKRETIKKRETDRTIEREMKR